MNEAIDKVLSEAERLEPEEVDVRGAVGRILAEDVRSPEAVPPFPASVKDGYAVAASQGAGVFRVVGAVTAGRRPDFAVGGDGVAYITTGAPLPPGADAVVMVERTEAAEPPPGEPAPPAGAPEPVGGRFVRIYATVKPGDDVRPVGSDIGEGELLVPAGACVGPSEVGLLVSVGVRSVKAYRRPRVAVLSTGDELVDPFAAGPSAGAPLPYGLIRDSNSEMLAGALAEGGFPGTLRLGIASDRPGDLEAKLMEGLERADVVLTSGGVSMGELDLLHPLLEREGTVHFGRVLMKPGKPLTFATVLRAGRKKLVFALPGNPVSAAVCFNLAALPALRKMAGTPEPFPPRVKARITTPLKLDPERPEYHRARLRFDAASACFVAESTGSQASSRLASLRSANAYLELPRSAETLAPGTLVDALLVGQL
eukprot:tig00020960_g16583.t1